MLGKNINLPVIQGYWNLEIRTNQFWANLFVNLGPKIFFLIVIFKSHSNVYIGHIYQFNQLIINENNVLQLKKESVSLN